MILLDPDLSLDPSSMTNRAPSTVPGLTDRQDRVPSARVLAQFLRAAQVAVRLRGQVSVLLTTDREIRRLNRQFRGKDKATDVLSFPAVPVTVKQRVSRSASQQVSGDLAISVRTALRQAREQGHALVVEIKVLMLHGLLHLAGFDHERDNGEMARRERVLRGRLGLPLGLIERSGRPTLSPKSRRKDGARGVKVKGRASRKAGPSTVVAGATSAQDDKQLKRRRA